MCASYLRSALVASSISAGSNRTFPLSKSASSQSSCREQERAIKTASASCTLLQVLWPSLSYLRPCKHTLIFRASCTVGGVAGTIRQSAWAVLVPEVPATAAAPAAAAAGALRPAAVLANLATVCMADNFLQKQPSSHAQTSPVDTTER
jgi:hypothetical protein